jgi:hypothetical protein
MMSASPLWAITSYFNPLGYRRRLANYHAFRRHLAAPLLTIEMTFGREPELGDADADIMLRCTEGDVMWQKERLLNHALASLPPQCRYVAWIDCDVVFEKDWPAQAVEALHSVPLVQLFSRVHHAPQAAAEPVRGRFSEASVLTLPSLIYMVDAGASKTELLNTPRMSASGFGWAARRELLQAHGWYDASILGGGDHAFAGAALGHFDISARRQRMHGRRREAYLKWARDFYADVGGKVSFLDQAAVHLWHGDLQFRRYGERHAGLELHGFDPQSDLVASAQGAWCWARSNPGLHTCVRNHFESRNEDGVAHAPALFATQ